MDTPPSAARMLDHRVCPARVHAIRQTAEEIDNGLGPHGVRSVLLIVGAFVAILEIGGRALRTLSLTGDIAELALKALICVLLMLLLVRLGWWSRVGLVPPSQWEHPKLFWVPAAWLTGLFVTGLPYPESVDRLLLKVPLAAVVGFWEEGLFRGLVLLVLLSVAFRKGTGPIRPALIAATLFGLAHLINLSDGQPLATFAQVTYATFSGIALGALLLRANSLWLVAATHALVNAKSGLASPSTSDSR